MALLVIKAVRLKVTQFLSGNLPVDPGFTHGKLPRCLKGLTKFIINHEELAFVMTVLFFARRITLPAEPDLTSITAPMSGTVSEDLLSYIPGFTKALVKRLKPSEKRSNKLRKFSWEEYHLTTKVGPSGNQALVSCLDDLENIPDSLRRSIAVLGGPSLEEKMERVYRNKDLLRSHLNQPKSGKTDFRRLSAIEDSEGKTRMIAIGDY